MTKPFARILLLSTSLLVAAAPFAERASAASSTPVYTQKDSGKTEYAHVGDKFKVRLKTCADCGDSWSFSRRPDSHVVKLVSTSKRSTATPPAVGGNEIITWTFKAVGNGSTKFALAEHSASQHNKVIKRFSLTIQVTQLPRSG